MKNFAVALGEVSEGNTPFVVVTLTGVRGSAPQEQGAKMIVTPGGREWGTVGGGKVENHCIGYAMEVLKGNEGPHARTWNLQTEIGMSCGGEVTFFFDVEPGHRWQVAIFGAGHISQALVPILANWECRLKVFDTRKDWLERLPRSSNLTTVLSTDLPAEVEDLGEATYLLAMTQGHGTDFPVLDRALQKGTNFGFLGVIGSDVKGARLRRELSAAGHDPERVALLQCPLGLPLGNNTPGEIAVSIAAQLLGIRDRVSFSLDAGALHRSFP